MPVAKWQKSAEGWVKMNCDVACDKQKGCVGMGVLIRDHIGKVKAARSTTRLGCFEPAVAEVLVLLHRLLFCKEIGIQNVMVEGDAQVVITALQEDTPTRARFGHIVDDMKMVLQDVSSWQASHVRRDAAYSLAKLATRNVIDRTWMNTTLECICPEFICDIVLQELYVSV